MNRRDLLTGAGAAFTTSLFTGNVKGANDRVAVGYIGLGAMGSGNLGYGMKVPEVQVAALCDVYQPHLERAQAAARKSGSSRKRSRISGEMLADKSIDAVCISTPDHWHAYMTVEACKAGQGCLCGEARRACTSTKGRRWSQAARKYKRVVQAGTMQRSGGYFQKAKEIVKSGDLGRDHVRAYVAGWADEGKEGWGNPGDSEPPAGLDWDMWLGPRRRCRSTRTAGVLASTTFPTFRYFWDYAGGAMTDWGVHLIDPIHQCLDEPMPLSINAFGRSSTSRTTRETPDSMMATWEYPSS